MEKPTSTAVNKSDAAAELKRKAKERVNATYANDVKAARRAWRVAKQAIQEEDTCVAPAAVVATFAAGIIAADATECVEQQIRRLCDDIEAKSDLDSSLDNIKDAIVEGVESADRIATGVRGIEVELTLLRQDRRSLEENTPELERLFKRRRVPSNRCA